MQIKTLYKIRTRKNNLKLHNINNKDLFNLFGIILNRKGTTNETREKVIEYARKHNVEKSVIMTFTGAVNCNIDYNAIKKEGDAGMCTVFEETRKEGLEQGLKTGRIEGQARGIVELGLEFGLSKEDILKKLEDKLNISLQKAQEYLVMFEKQTCSR